MNDEALCVLVVDVPGATRDGLVRELEKNEHVAEVKVGNGLCELTALEKQSRFNVVFIDPLAYPLNEASAEIFQVRIRVPDIVFVLFVDPDEVEARRHEFFVGERQRFLHYYRLVKTLPDHALAPNLEVALDLSIYDLEWQLSKQGIERLKLEVGRITDDLSRDVTEQLLGELSGRMSHLRRRGSATWTKQHERTVFLSYTFEETEYGEGLKELLGEHGFRVVTGDNTNTYISEAICKRIEDSSLFVSLMTKKYALSDGTFLPSLWLVEEKALAIATLKPMVLMVERGVKEIGGLQSDYQRIEFTEKGFTRAALRAVKQLESYAGSSIKTEDLSDVV